MPKKSKKTTSEKQKKQQKQTKGSKLILSQEEKNSLEQKIKENPKKIDSEDLKEIIKQQNIKSSPSLEKINPPEKIPVILERDVITGNMSIKNIEDRDNKNSENSNYITQNQEIEQQKYTPLYGEKMAEIVSKKELEMSSSKDFFRPNEIKFQNSFKEEIPEIESFEKYSSRNFNIENFDPLKKPKKDIFEKKEVKYTSSGY